MLAKKLFPLLTKPEVQELILLVGKPPCAVVNGSYRRLSAQTLQDEDIMAVIMFADGQDHAAHLADGVQWDFVAPGVGKISAAARYDGPNLRMSLRLAGLSVQSLPAVDPRGLPQSAAETSPARARRDAAQSGESAGTHRALGPEPHATARAPRGADPQAREGRPRSSASSQNIAAQPQAREGRPRGSASSQNIAAQPQGLEGRARGSASSQDISAQPQPAAEPLELDSLSPAPRIKPQRVREIQDPTSREARLELEAFDPSLRDAPEPGALAAAPPSIQARRIPELDSLDEPVASPPRAAARPAARATGNGDPLDALFDRARQLRASDLHVLADRPATLRIAGELVPQPEVFDGETLSKLLLPRIPAAVRATLERDGSCDFALAHPEHGRFRANVGRQRTGLKLTARPIGENVPTLTELGLPTSIESALEHHQGLIVITGPTGHGKTTTLAALTGILNRETSHHVITVEDPIEYVHPTARAVISQREVGTHTKTFGAALKGALREDPDVIVVGELRDTETVRMALSASETGHLVISTMNTPSAAKAIERLIDLFPPGDQPQVRMTLAGGLRLIISQRLVPTADRKQLVAACEVLPGSTPLWALIRENRTYQIASLQQRGRSIGIIRLDDSLADLVKSGKTTLEIAREYADSTELLTTLIQTRPQPARAEQQTPENQNDPDNTLQKRGVELGKQVLSRAGKLFGGENK